MSLDEFQDMSADTEAPPDDSGEQVDESQSWNYGWDFNPNGVWDSVDPQFFGEDTPNSPPLISVSEKLAAEIEIIEDDGLVEEVAEFMFPHSPDGYDKVLRVVYNDLSTWHLPLKPWDKDNLNMIDQIVDDYVPEVIQWRAIVNGDDPDKALEEWQEKNEDDLYSWEDDLEDTEIDETTRNWFNDHADWLPHLDKVVSNDRDVDLDIEDDDGWEDDW